MAVYRGSRYQGTKATGVLVADGTIRPFMHLRDPLTSEDVETGFVSYETKSGDELDGLAFQAGGKSTLWWILADINEIFFSLDLPIGVNLTVPTQKFFRRY